MNIYKNVSLSNLFSLKVKVTLPAVNENIVDIATGLRHTAVLTGTCTSHEILLLYWTILWTILSLEMKLFLIKVHQLARATNQTYIHVIINWLHQKGLAWTCGSPIGFKLFICSSICLSFQKHYFCDAIAPLIFKVTFPNFV